MSWAQGRLRVTCLVRFCNVMGRKMTALVSAVALAWAGAVPVPATAQQSAKPATALVFDGVTVVDVEHGTLIPAQRIVVVGHRIYAMGTTRAVKLPPGAQVVDARGKYLIPGLWDMHTHPTYYTDIWYPAYLTYGTTGIRDAGSPIPLDSLRRWRREILTGTRVGPPRQILSGPTLDYNPTNDGSCNGPPPRQWIGICFTDSARARAIVDSLKAAGADMIKIHDGMDRAQAWKMYFVIAAEARRLGIPFGGHAEAESLAAIRVSDSGARIIDHFQISMPNGLRVLCTDKDSASVAQCQSIAERLRRNDTWVVPTPGLFIFDSSADFRIVERVGLPLLAGTDGSPGSLHRSMAKFVKAGLTPLTVLQSATLNPAKFLHATDSLGTVATGKLADLVLLDANPLADITNIMQIRAVVANGRYFDRGALDRLLAEAQAKAKAQP